ncbi:MAG: aminotransferase class I/II-fold pyridoxal phosphate-dependent enzyme [Bacteroidota bacterium]
MSDFNRVMRSEYMHYAKTLQHATYNLAISGMANYPAKEIPFTLDDIDIHGINFYGYPPLVELIAKKCGVKKENIVSTLGASMANYLAMAAIIEPGDEILVEHPTYELLLAAAGYLGAKIKRFPRHPENGFQLDARDVQRAITSKTRLIVITNLHNPSSSYANQDVLKTIGRIAEGIGAYVLVGEVYLDSMFEKAPPTSFLLGDHFVTTSSLTKVYGLSGLRCGWVLAEPKLVERIYHIINLHYGNQAHPAERLSVVALQHLDKIAKRSQSLLNANRPLVNNFLDSRSDLRLVRPEYGTIIFPELATGNASAFCDLLRTKYETSVAPGHFFEMPDYFRLGLCGETEILKQGLNRIGKALDEHAKK